MAGTTAGDYQLGHDDAELERLNRQGRILAPATRTILEAAGLRPGMRVLDLGSGMGDLAFAAAELVGPAGEVVGVERSAETVVRANARARTRGLDRVAFVAGDIHQAAPCGPFDAIIGRLVLMYVADPVAVLRTQASLLNPGGRVAAIEFDALSVASLPSTPLVERVRGWIAEAFTRSGVLTSLGPRLWALLQESGLHPVGMLAVQPMFGPHDEDGAWVLAGVVRTILALIERTGVATAEQVGAATLEQRLGAQLQAASAVLAHPVLYGAWATAAG